MRVSSARWRAFAAGVAAVLGLGSAAQAQAPAPPAAWVAYAEDATVAVSGWLSEDSEAAVRARGYLLAGRSATTLELKIWIEANGAVSRIGFAPLGDAAADAALTTALVSRRLPPPPPRMTQPLRLAVDMEVRDAVHPEGVQATVNSGLFRELP